MKSARDIEQFIREASVHTAGPTDARVVNGMYQAYERSLPKPRSSGRPDYWALLLGSRVVRLAVAAVVLLAMATLIGELGSMLTSGSVAWAEVTQRFQSVPFFTVTVYMKEDATAEPTQMELWMSRDGRARVRVGTQIIFARRGQVTDAFDVKSRAPVAPDERAVFFLGKLGETEEFSLDAIIRVMFGGEMQDVTPLVNPGAVISQDVVVFDVDLPGTPEWVRIWALRESRLPVRIRVWDPRDGEMTDAVLEYSKEQADEFFDPNAFLSLMDSEQAVSRTNFAYAFLRDPGGRQVTPEDMFAQSGYHMPEIEHVGITPKGAVWVIADKGMNRSRDGRPFYGFAQIEDDLGREYERVYATHETLADQSREVFVPLDYPFDERTPKRITLTCRNDSIPHLEQEVVGAVDLTEWQQDQLWPEGTIRSSEQQLTVNLAWLQCNAKPYDRAERLLTAIEGWPEDDPAALERERIRLRILINQDRTDDALALAGRLMPLLERKYRTWSGSAPSMRIFGDCLVAFACAGELDQAKQTWRRVRSIEPELSPKLNDAALKHIRESMRYSLETCLRLTALEMSRKARLTVDQINEILDIDIRKDEIFKHDKFADWDPVFEKPEYKNWERHLSELAEHYKTHPLPETMELHRHEKKGEYGARLLTMRGIDGYLVELLNRPLKNYTCFYNFPESVGRVRMEGEIPDIELGHDLIYREGIDQQQRIRFLLDQLGLEVVEVNEPRTVWIARHDGSARKDPEQVHAPVRFDASGTIKTGMMSSSARPGFGFEYLFRNFMWWQNQDYSADCVVIIDETGVTGPVSCEGPNWEGPKAPAIARKWFEDELGVTFTEETRTMTTYVIRRKERAK